MRQRVLGLLGLGSLGEAVASVASKSETKVIAWSRRFAEAGEPPPTAVADLDQMEVVADPREVLKHATTICFALPSYAYAPVLDLLGSCARGNHQWFHATKGADAEGLFVHEIIRRQTCVKKIGVVAGPLVANELPRSGPTGLVIGSRFDCVIDAISDLMFGNTPHIHRTNDIVGVEIASALRNVVSIAALIAQPHGEAMRSAVLAHGLAEAAKLGKALGADPQTFVGLAGVGDLIASRETTDMATPLDQASRGGGLYNPATRGANIDKESILAQVTQECALTAHAVARRAVAMDLELPLTRGVADVLEATTSSAQMLKAIIGNAHGIAKNRIAGEAT